MILTSIYLVIPVSALPVGARIKKTEGINLVEERRFEGGTGPSRWYTAVWRIDQGFLPPRPLSSACWTPYIDSILN